MIKLHEIPIYAFTKNELQKRYEKRVAKLRSFCEDVDKETIEKCIQIDTFPHRLWEHNHLVGYIDIIFDGRDISFEVYLPHQRIERYHWKRNNKIFLYNVMANGTHFFVEDKMTNADIQAKISEMLKWIIEDHIPEKFYVERTTFDAINDCIDYKNLLKNYNNRRDIYDKHS